MLLAIPLSGCVPSDPAPTTFDRCAQAEDFFSTESAKADRIASELRRMVADGAIVTRDPTDGFSIFTAQWSEAVGGAYDAWGEKQREGMASLKAALRVIVNEPSCFKPGEVAAAEEALSSWGG